jgi:hypothetical protein
LSDYLSTVLADNPLQFLPLQETSGTIAHDLSGNGRNGTYVGGMTLGQPSLLSGAPGTKSVMSDNTSGYVSTTFAPFTAPGTPESFTFEGWSYAANASDIADAFFCSDGASPYASWAEYLDAPPLGDYTFWPSSVASSVGSWPGSFPTGQSFHWVLIIADSTLDGTFVGLFVNGINVLGDGSFEDQDPIVGVTGNVLWGTDTTGLNVDHPAQYYWNGRYAYLAIYSGLLSPTRILAHYNAGITGARSEVLVPLSVSNQL